MKIVFWNAYHGFEKSQTGMLPPQERKKQFANWLNEQQADVVILLEMTGFDHTKLGVYASRWGHSNVLINSGTFPIAITSRWLIQSPFCHYQNMTNGFVMAKIQELDLFVTHIPPEQYAIREIESQELLSHLIPLMRDNRSPLIFADLNSLPDSPLPNAMQAIGLQIGCLDGGVDYIMNPHTKPMFSLVNQEELSDHPALILPWPTNESENDKPTHP